MDPQPGDVGSVLTGSTHGCALHGYQEVTGKAQDRHLYPHGRLGILEIKFPFCLPEL